TAWSSPAASAWPSDLEDLELLAVAAGGGQLHVDPLGDAGEGGGRLAIGVGDHDGAPGVAALPQLGQEGHLAQEGGAEAVGQLVATTGAEELVALAVVAREPAHVLDDALHGEVHLLGHEAGPLGHLLGGRLG